MRLVALPNPGLGNTSYLVDLGDGSGLVVDPERDPRPYVDAAERLGLEIRHVAETHLHADFVSGARELMAMGATLIAPRESRLAYPYVPVGDGDEVAVGDYLLRVVGTPGHTPEHVAYVVSEASTPQVVFSGGTLMAGGVARPDLISPELTRPLARDACRSVRRLLEMLPGDVEVRPTHGGGSFCSSTSVTSTAVSTIASEQLNHPAALDSDPEEFAQRLLAGLGSYPTYFRRLRKVNQSGPDVFGPDLPELDSIPAEDLGGRVIIDVRPIEQFAAGHVPDSVSIELRGQFGTWLGWLFEPDTPIVFVLDSDQDERDLVRQALNIGHRAIAGRLDLDDWLATGGQLATIELMPADAIALGATIVDVRQHSEWSRGHVDGAIHCELGDLGTRFPDVPDGSVVHCGHGQRAMTAASLLHRQGAAGIGVTAAGHVDVSAARAASVTS